MLNREENDNRIQVIWNDIQSIVKTDANALDIFCRHWQNADLVHCANCSSDKIIRAPGERQGECGNCGEAWWITSGTLLDRASLFKGYLAGALFFEEGLTISGPEFSRLTDIPQTSAYNILRKLRMAICNQMPDNAKEFSGQIVKLLIGKRTRETQANCHPLSEQELIDEALLVNNESDEPDMSNNSLDVVDNTKSAGEENLSDYEKAKKTVHSLLSNVGLTADTISLKTGIAIGRVTASLSELELFGEARVEPGGKYFKITPLSHSNEDVDESMAKQIIEAISTFVSFVVEYFHRVGRKGIQTYVAALWCALDREHWGKNSVLRLCGEHPPVPYRVIRDYVSPPLLRIMVG